MDIKTQYYRSFAGESNISSDEQTLMVNCAGIVSSTNGFYNNNIRRDYYLMYVTEGEMKVCLDKKEVYLPKGKAVVISPGTRFVYKVDPGALTEYLWIHFTGSEAGSILKGLHITQNEAVDVGIHMTLRELWKRLYREFIISDDTFRITSGAILSYILANISRYKNTSGSKLIKSVEYINLHYAEDIRVSELAENEKISETVFRRIFYEVTGLNPVEYITKVRVNAAASLLENTDKTLSEIARLTGFQDEYYFGRVFKKSSGISPGAYRKKIKDRNRDFR